MVRRLFTIGYEGINIETFISILNNHSINCLLDVRELPLSRKPGFSKNTLEKKLQNYNIAYIHLKELGSPKPVRDRLRLNKNFQKFFAAMDKHLARKSNAIEQAYTHVVNNTCCLMCFEHLYEHCHRSLVAHKIKVRDGNGLRVLNL